MSRRDMRERCGDGFAEVWDAHDKSKGEKNMLTCQCGKAMGTFEAERFGWCGYCQEERLTQVADAKNAEKKRAHEAIQVEYARKKAEKEQKLIEAKDKIRAQVQLLDGKTITEISIDDWHAEWDGANVAVFITSLSLYFSDETSVMLTASVEGNREYGLYPELQVDSHE